MDGLSGTVVQAYRSERYDVLKNKNKKTKLATKGKKADDGGSPKPKEEQPAWKRKLSPRSSKKDDVTLKGIGKSTSEDCCACVKIVVEYIREVFQFICCVSQGGIERETRFSEMFCELGDATVRLGRDVFNLIKCVLRSVYNIAKND